MSSRRRVAFNAGPKTSSPTRCPLDAGKIRAPAERAASDRDDAAKAGFEDAFIYAEMPKPPSERQIPMRRVALAEAVFQPWIDKPDEIAY